MPEPWVQRTIGDCLSSEFAGEWGAPPRGGGNATVLRSTDIDDEGHVNLDGGARRTIPGKKLASKRLTPGDILLESSGGGPGKPVGRVALFEGGNGDAYLSSNFFRTLRPDARSVVSRFLRWKLQHFYASPRIWLLQQQTTGIINLKYGDYLRSPIALPPLPEQRQIAEILDTTDDTIRKTERIIAKLKLVKQGLLHDLLTRGIADNGELRDPERHPEQFKDSPLGRIPKEWDVSDFGRLAGECVLGTPRRGVDPSGDNLHLLKMGNLTWGGLDLAVLEPVARSRVVDWQRLLLRAGDLLFNTRNTPELVGKTAAWRGELANVVADNNILRVRFDETVNGVFLAAYMGNGAGRRQIGQLATGTTSVAAVYWRSLSRLLVPRPPRREQDEIVTRLDHLEQAMAREEGLLEKLRVLKRALMEDLLTGRVPVTKLLETTAP